jgi:dienelactone hydrolase
MGAVKGVRERVLDGMQQVMGPLPKRPSTAASMEVIASVELEHYLRQKIEIDREIPAYLFLPKQPAVAAGVLCLHQTTRPGKAEPAGIAGRPNLHYAFELAEAGFVTLAPDYPNFGEYSFDPYAHGFVSASMKGIVNHMRAVDVLLRVPGVRKVGVIGHSLGGHNSLFVAAFDQRIQAVVTSCGFTSFHKYYKGDLTGWSHKGYMPRIATVYGKSPDRMPFDFDGVLSAIAPRPVFINAPLHDANFDASGVDDCVTKSAKPNHITVVHPDCQHDFPPEVRKQSYEFLRTALL